jgi:hypothetical protein
VRLCDKSSKLALDDTWLLRDDADNYIPVFIGLVPCIIMSNWTSHPSSTPISAAYASYFISYICLGTAPLIFAWLSELYVWNCHLNLGHPK